MSNETILLYHAKKLAVCLESHTANIYIHKHVDYRLQPSTHASPTAILAPQPPLCIVGHLQINWYHCIYNTCFVRFTTWNQIVHWLKLPRETSQSSILSWHWLLLHSIGTCKASTIEFSIPKRIAESSKANRLEMDDVIRNIWDRHPHSIIAIRVSYQTNTLSARMSKCLSCTLIQFNWKFVIRRSLCSRPRRTAKGPALCRRSSQVRTKR
jgi:hypothetical protein